MPEILLHAKINVPPPRRNTVRRGRLLTQLNRGLEQHGKLTIVCAPAGFGKTTLLSQWVAELDRPVAWLSLDVEDNDHRRLLTHLYAALAPIRSGTKDEPALTPAPGQAIKSALTELICELAAVPASILILDDFQVIANRQIHDAFLSALPYLPPQMHLVLSSRSQLPWPLARLRANGAVNELGINDLRFRPAETRAFLSDTMALALADQDIDLLDERTEGWISGLQLAALSLSRRADRASILETLSASNRFIFDFLAEEVFDNQPAAIQEFLLQTSILTRLNESLCDAVRQASGSQAFLDWLDRGNLFLIALDDRRDWYRYHFLFADFLQKRLARTAGARLPELHQRAGRWYAQAGLVDEAIRYAKAGGDLAAAAGLVAANARQIVKECDVTTMAGWLAGLPETLIRADPWLAVSQAFVLEFTRRGDVEQWLQWAEMALDAGAGRRPGEEHHCLSGLVAVIRSHNALAFGDIPRAVAQANRAIALLRETDPLWLEIGPILGCAHWSLGNRAAAEKEFARSAAASQKLGQPFYVAASTCYYGLQRAKLGRLREADTIYAHALSVAARPDGRKLQVAAFPLTRMADLRREWHELDASASMMAEGVDLAERFGQADVLSDAYVQQARLSLAQGNITAAQAAVDLAEQVVAANPVDGWILGWLAGCRVQIWLARGDLDGALQWAASSGLTADGELSFHHDLHHIHLARLLIARSKVAPAASSQTEARCLLARLLTAAEAAGWVHETIEILTLQAALAQSAGDDAGGLAALRRALTLAEPGGYLRVFLDAGAPIRQLLERIPPIERTAQVNRLLLLAVGESGPGQSVETRPVGPEHLSQREAQVLRLLNTPLSSTEIADHLVISPNTVRFHIKNIYSKLGVHDRWAAIARAQSLDLL